MYLFGMHVESKVRESGEKVKNAKQQARKQKDTLALLLREDPPEQKGQEVVGYVHDPTDPVSLATAQKMPPAVKFDSKQFADPAVKFRQAREKSTAKG